MRPDTTTQGAGAVLAGSSHGDAQNEFFTGIGQKTPSDPGESHSLGLVAENRLELQRRPKPLLGAALPLPRVEPRLGPGGNFNALWCAALNPCPGSSPDWDREDDRH